MAGLSCEYISPVGESKMYFYHHGVGYLDSRDQRCDNYRQSFHDHSDDNGMETAWSIQGPSVDSNHVMDSPWRDSPSCQDSSCELHALANPTYDSDYVTGSARWTDSSWNDGLLEENEELHFQLKSLEKQLESLKEKNRAQKDELSRMKVRQIKDIADMNNLADKHQRTISNTKKLQWCISCEGEAFIFCCWNTSYCSITCQQIHWHKEHQNVCQREQMFNDNYAKSQCDQPIMVDAWSECHSSVMYDKSVM